MDTKVIVDTLKSINVSHRNSIIQLIIAVGDKLIEENPEIKTIGFGSVYEYNDEDYNYNYYINCDEIEINGFNLWQIQSINESKITETTGFKSFDSFHTTAEKIADMLHPFEDNLHTVFGENVKFIISKNKVDIESYDI